jgi:hypothetical protein
MFSFYNKNTQKVRKIANAPMARGLCPPQESEKN